MKWLTALSSSGGAGAESWGQWSRLAVPSGGRHSESLVSVRTEGLSSTPTTHSRRGARKEGRTLDVELTPQEAAILNQLELLLRQGRVLEEAVETLRVMGIDSELLGVVVSARQAIIDQRRHIADRSALIDPEDAPRPWYTGPSEQDIFWPKLRHTLESDPGWASAVPSLDESSTDVVGLLADPHSPTIATRGLVLGYVQSGKTANFTATIAKAADAGYRLFIVLSGVHNALRRQTQIRLEDQLHAPHPTKWVQLTDEFRDFGRPVKALPLVAGTDLRLLAVVKKNVFRLTRLRDWLMQAHEHGGLDTCPVLIIDDESDQASPNAARNADLDRTKINQRIVELLQLPRVAYVGYTATPFANVLINPADRDDLYPRSFIYSLPKPDSYFGSEELFGLGVTEDEESKKTTPHDMIRTIPSSPENDEAGLYRIRAKEPFTPVVSPTLETAIRWFLLATSARRARSGSAAHSSMLIHTTMRVAPQLQYIPLIRERIRAFRDEWEAGETKAWSDQWAEEQRREPSGLHGLPEVSFDELSVHLDQVLTDVKVVADNSQSTERLIYTSDPATVIAVGGNTLSRGLTLEGLVSSFFLRSASAYDSLLQMGRWFGYRRGYADLPRIWTTEELAKDFRFLAEVERDLRQEIDRYAIEGSTPEQLPVRIRVHPRMQVTAALRMQFAVAAAASYSGLRPQTTYFHHRDPNAVSGNVEAGRHAVESALARGANLEVSTSKVILRDVPSEVVLQLIADYSFHPDTEMSAKLLIDYIEGQIKYEALEMWNLGIITRQPPARSINLGLDEEVPLITRSKLKSHADPQTANIGTLMSRPDRVADLLDSTVAVPQTDTELLDARTASGRALVLLYPIDKDSEPKPSASHRSKLAAVGDLLGLAFSFPRAVPGSEHTDKIVVDPDLLAEAQRFRDEEVEDEVYEDDEGDRDDVDLGDG